MPISQIILWLTPFLYCLGPRVAEPKKWFFPNFIFKGWEWCIWTITTIIHPPWKTKKKIFDSRQLKSPFSKYCMLIIYKLISAKISAEPWAEWGPTRAPRRARDVISLGRAGPTGRFDEHWILLKQTNKSPGRGAVAS